MTQTDAHAGHFVAENQGSDAGRPSPQTQGGSHQDPPEAERPKELLAAAALVAYLVQPGDTLSGIAASHSVSLAAVEAANAQLSNPNLIYAGQTLQLPEGSSAAQAPSATPQTSTAAQTSTASASASQSASSAGSPSSIATAVTQPSPSGSSGYSSSDLSDIPGVPQSLAACVAYRESTDLQNPAADGNAYGIIPASGYNVAGTSLASQKQVFAELYQQDGASPWAADGCPGT
jgi:LysM repeat protein